MQGGGLVSLGWMPRISLSAPESSLIPTTQRSSAKPIESGLLGISLASHIPAGVKISPNSAMNPAAL
jgi:hypothetical protein